MPRKDDLYDRLDRIESKLESVANNIKSGSGGGRGGDFLSDIGQTATTGVAASIGASAGQASQLARMSQELGEGQEALANTHKLSLTDTTNILQDRGQISEDIADKRMDILEDLSTGWEEHSEKFVEMAEGVSSEQPNKEQFKFTDIRPAGTETEFGDIQAPKAPETIGSEGRFKLTAEPAGTENKFGSNVEQGDRVIGSEDELDFTNIEPGGGPLKEDGDIGVKELALAKAAEWSGSGGITGTIGTAATTAASLAAGIAPYAAAVAPAMNMLRNYDKLGQEAVQSRGVWDQRSGAMFGEAAELADPIEFGRQRAEAAKGFAGRGGTDLNRWEAEYERRQADYAERYSETGFTQARGRAGAFTSGMVGRAWEAGWNAWEHAKYGVYRGEGWAEENILGTIPDREGSEEGRRAIAAQLALTGHPAMPSPQHKAIEEMQRDMPGAFGVNTRGMSPAGTMPGGGDVTVSGRTSRMSPQEIAARKWRNKKVAEIYRLHQEGKDKQATKKANQYLDQLNKNVTTAREGFIKGLKEELKNNQSKEAKKTRELIKRNQKLDN